MERNSFGDIFITVLAIGFWLMFTLNLSPVFIVIFVVVMLIIGAFCLFNGDGILSSLTNRSQDKNKENLRKAALCNVRLYLAPHKSIWRNLRIANKYCVLTLGSDGKTITGYEKSSAYGGICEHRTLKILYSPTHSNEDLWNMFCLRFDHLTSYEGLMELAERFGAKTISSTPDNQQGVSTPTVVRKIEIEPKEKLDINNASEVELTALPGISIVISKKIIKKREAIGGFKNLDDFFLFLKLKPHMESQLRPMLCVKKMKGSLKIERSDERKVDL